MKGFRFFKSLPKDGGKVRLYAQNQDKPMVSHFKSDNLESWEVVKIIVYAMGIQAEHDKRVWQKE